MPNLRDRHKETRRARILDAACALVRELPDDAVTIERVADRAGVAPATVYNLIGAREALWAELGSWTIQEVETRLATVEATDPVARARAIVATAIDVCIEDPLVTRTLLDEWRDSGQLFCAERLHHLCEALTNAKVRGQLRSDCDPATLAGVIACAGTGALAQWVAGVLDDAQVRELSLAAVDVAIATAAAEQGELPTSVRLM